MYSCGFRKNCAGIKQSNGGYNFYEKENVQETDGSCTFCRYGT